MEFPTCYSCYDWWKNLKSVDETVGEKNVSGESGSFLNTWVPNVGERKRAKAKQGETDTTSAGQHVNINMGEVDWENLYIYMIPWRDLDGIWWNELDAGMRWAVWVAQFEW